MSGENEDLPEEGEAIAETLTCTVSAEDNGARLDKALAGYCGGLSRSRLKALILEGCVTVAGKVCEDPSAKLKSGVAITVNLPPPVAADPQPENIPLDIVFEDDALLVVNKPAGLVVHPGAGNHTGTLVNALLYHCGDTLSGIGGVRRPGIVHRLDKDTSGLMIVAKTDKAHKKLASQLEDRTLGRHYKALVWGKPSLKKGRIDYPIGRHPSHRLKMTVITRTGRSATTHYAVEQTFGETAALLDCRLETGRTHQIRVHMAHVKHPLLGDPLYGLQVNAAQSLMRKGGYETETAQEILAFPRQALHAWQIHFIHPLENEEMVFEAPLPEDMESLINLLKSAS